MDERTAHVLLHGEEPPRPVGEERREISVRMEWGFHQRFKPERAKFNGRRQGDQMYVETKNGRELDLTWQGGVWVDRENGDLWLFFFVGDKFFIRKEFTGTLWEVKSARYMSDLPVSKSATKRPQ